MQKAEDLKGAGLAVDLRSPWGPHLSGIVKSLTKMFKFMTFVSIEMG